MIKQFIILLLIIPSLAFAVAPEVPTSVAVDTTPNWVYDETFPFRVYSENYGDWKTEIAFGNFVTYMEAYDSPGTEAGYSTLRICDDGPVDSGKFYCAVAPGLDWPYLVEYDYATKTTRLRLDKDGLVEGYSGEAMAGYPFYNPYDDTLYLMGRGFCIRKLVDNGGTYSVELVSGNCDEYGAVDGDSVTSRFGALLGATADGAGNLWVADSFSGSTRIRKVDVNGAVTTVDDWTRDDGSGIALSVLNSPYIEETMSPGRDSTNVHIADSWKAGNPTNGGWSAQRFNTSTHAMTRVAGVYFTSSGNDTYGRSGVGQEKDGPALTHAYANASGRGSYYSKFYDSIIYVGQDNYSAALYSYKTDWVKVIMAHHLPFTTYPGYTDEELYSAPFPSEYDPIHASNTIPSVRGTDRYGGIWLSSAGSAKPAIRMYNPTLGGLSLGEIQ